MSVREAKSRETAFETDSDADLLGYMAMSSEDPSSAKAAGGEFYKRHAGWLHTAVRRTGLSGVSGGNRDEASKDLVQDTFVMAYRRAGTFVADRSAQDDPLRARAQVRAWLSSIAKNVFLSANRRNVQVDLAVVSLTPFEENRQQSGEGSEDSAKVRAMRDALEQLDTRERDILLTTLEYERPGAENQRLPNEVMRQLAERVRTTPENIRTIRKRAKAKLKDAVEKTLASGRGRHESQQK